MVKKISPKKQFSDTTDLIRKLQEGEERYLAFIRNSMEGIWRFELDKPIPANLSPRKQIDLMFQHAYLAEANEAMAKMYGLKSVKEIVGARLTDLMPRDDPENIAYLMAFIKSDYSLSGAESHEVDKKGNDKFFLNSLVGFVEDGKLMRAWGTQVDVTEHRKTVAALQESEERFRSMADTVPVFIWLSDTKNLGTYFNKPWLDFTGRTLKQELGTGWTKAVHPDDLKRAAMYCQKCFEARKEFRMEFRLRRHDGTYHWVLDHGIPRYSAGGKFLGYIGSCLDIDERKKFEIELHESEQRFRNMADAAPVLIWVAGPDKMLTYLNKVWLDFTGRKPGQDLGDGWQEVIHPEDLEYIKNVYFAAFDAREPYRAEYRVRRHDGKYLWMLDKGAPRYSPEGEFLGYVGSMIEVEEIKSTKKRQQELEEINRKLQQQREQLMELNNSKDEFISVASHQLRTPATGVKQYIGMLIDGYGGKLSTGQLKMLETAYESNERQLRIIDDLLKVAHVDAGKVTLIKIKTDLVGLIEDVIDEQADKFKQKRQGITFKHTNRDVMAAIDPERMRMVLENLIDNASKYSLEGKNVTVELNQTKKYIHIRVTDQGVGIAKRDIPQLFQKFSRLDNELSTRVGGTGLGLYWVKKMVGLHHGDISVESKLHRGTIFAITIPRNNA
jgi:PAS domain S-box-containing protein